MKHIDKVVAARLGATRVPGNSQPHAFNRQIAMYLMHRHSGWSLTQIGMFYNDRHHTTVNYSVKKIARLIESRENVRNLIGELVNQISDPSLDLAALQPVKNLKLHTVRDRHLEEFADLVAVRVMRLLAGQLIQPRPDKNGESSTAPHPSPDGQIPMEQSL